MSDDTNISKVSGVTTEYNTAASVLSQNTPSTQPLESIQSTKALKSEQTQTIQSTTPLESNQSQATQFSSDKVSNSINEDKTTKQTSSVQNKKSNLNNEQQIGINFPITHRGSFFNDSYFSSVLNDYKNAVENMLQSWNVPQSMNSNVINDYKSFKMNNFSDDNQAVSIKEDDKCHKVS